MIRLNARGKVIATRRDTLKLAPPNSVLGSLVAAEDDGEPAFARPPTVDGAYFIDVAAKDMHAILDMLVMGETHLTEEERGHLSRVAQYLNLTSVIDALAPRTLVFMVISLEMRKSLPFDAAHPIGKREAFVPVRVPVGATVRELNHAISCAAGSSHRTSVFLCKIGGQDRVLPRALVDLLGEDADATIADCVCGEQNDDVAAWVVVNLAITAHRTSLLRLPIRKDIVRDTRFTVIVQLFSRCRARCERATCYEVQFNSTVAKGMSNYLKKRGLTTDNSQAHVVSSRKGSYKLDYEKVWPRYSWNGMVVTVCHNDDAKLLVRKLQK